jgi:hypothetical protein
MRVFPLLTEVFTSPLPPAELLRRVAEATGPQGEFSGKVQANGFTISRVIDYRNSMLPRIDGHVSPGPAGSSRLWLQHRLSVFTLVFGVIWLGGVGSVVLGMGLALLQGELQVTADSNIWPSLIPVGMLAFGLLLFTVPFWLEVRKSRPQLVALLQLQEGPEDTPVEK